MRMYGLLRHLAPAAYMTCHIMAHVRSYRLHDLVDCNTLRYEHVHIYEAPDTEEGEAREREEGEG